LSATWLSDPPVTRFSGFSHTPRTTLPHLRAPSSPAADPIAASQPPSPPLPWPLPLPPLPPLSPSSLPSAALIFAMLTCPGDFCSSGTGTPAVCALHSRVVALRAKSRLQLLLPPLLIRCVCSSVMLMSNFRRGLEVFGLSVLRWPLHGRLLFLARFETP